MAFTQKEVEIITLTPKTKADVGMPNVDNTSDSAKPISTAVQTALDNKQAVDADLTAIAGMDSSTAGMIASAGAGWIKQTFAQVKTLLALLKGDIGLGNVDNTTDAGKPVSTAQQSALDGKESSIAAGTSAQYWRGDKTWQALAAVGTTNSYNSLADKPTIPTVPALSFYNAAGALTAPTKVWMGTVTPSTGNGYSIDVSSAGFSTVSGCQVIAIKNSGTAVSTPSVSIKSMSTSAVVVNITSGNGLTQTILGLSVLMGLPVIFADVTGVTLSVVVWGT